MLREWSLITEGRGWGIKREGAGASQVLSLQKVGAEEVLAMLKGGIKHFERVEYKKLIKCWQT